MLLLISFFFLSVPLPSVIVPTLRGVRTPSCRSATRSEENACPMLGKWPRHRGASGCPNHDSRKLPPLPVEIATDADVSPTEKCRAISLLAVCNCTLEQKQVHGTFITCVVDWIFCETPRALPPAPCCQVKVGHGGTLDPMATGVLVIGVGKGCRELGNFLKVRCKRSIQKQKRS